MSVLLLRLAGPMQSWGTQSRFTVRDTGLEPSKSGVIGLLCAALGKPRVEQPDDGFPTLVSLAALKMGVRVDREGSMKRDFHTALNVAKASGAKPDTVTSNRYYLADADFLVGLEGDRSLLERLHHALQSPVWPLFLGRKSFLPDRPVWMQDGLCDEPLERVLRKRPWFYRFEWERDHRRDRLRLVLAADFGTTSEVRRDVPVSFELGLARRYAIRHVETRFVDLTPEMVKEDVLCFSRA